MLEFDKKIILKKKLTTMKKNIFKFASVAYSITPHRSTARVDRPLAACVLCTCQQPKDEYRSRRRSAEYTKKKESKYKWGHIVINVCMTSR